MSVRCLQPSYSPAAECLYLRKVKLKRKGEPRPASGGFYRHIRGPYLTSKVAKNLFIFVAYRHPSLLSPNHLRTVQLETASIHTFDLNTLSPTKSMYVLTQEWFKYGKVRLNVFLHYSVPKSLLLV